MLSIYYKLKEEDQTKSAWGLGKSVIKYQNFLLVGYLTIFSVMSSLRILMWYQFDKEIPIPLIWIFLWTNLILFVFLVCLLIIFGILFSRFRSMYVSSQIESRGQDQRNLMKQARKVRIVVWFLCLSYLINAIQTCTVKPIAFFIFEQHVNEQEATSNVNFYFTMMKIFENF